MTSITFSAPPNQRQSESCGTCRQWRWADEGAGYCLKFPRSISANGRYHDVYEDEASTMLCDAWECFLAPKDSGDAQ